MIFIDSNIPMYLVGADHANKSAAIAELDSLISQGERMVTDAEAFQEVLHRYVAIDRRDAIQAAFDSLRALADEVFPVEISDVERAKVLLAENKALSARDALHLAIMQSKKVDRILTFDRHFDAMKGLTRIP